MSWWMQSGFIDYPGTYVRVSPDDYWLCRPWGGQLPGSRQDATTHVTSRFGSVTGAAQGNFAVLLPDKARIVAVYCGAAPASQPLAECAGKHCAIPTHFQVEDGLYTKGRGITFSVRAHTTDPAQRSDVGFWVVWR